MSKSCSFARPTKRRAHCISLRILLFDPQLIDPGFHVCQFRIGHFLEVVDFRHLFPQDGNWSNINCVGWQVLQGERCEVSTAKLAGAVASEQRTTLNAPSRLQIRYRESPNTDIGAKSMHFRQSSAQNRSKGQHMQKAEMSIPRIAPVKKAVKAVKAETVTLRHLAMALADNNGLPKAKVNAMLMGMVGDITKHLKKGKRIRLNGLGILQVRKRPARMGRNPATGETIKIKASKKIAFRAAKDLKQSI